MNVRMELTAKTNQQDDGLYENILCRLFNAETHELVWHDYALVKYGATERNPEAVEKMRNRALAWITENGVTLVD